MKKFWEFVKAVSAVGFVVSVIICFICLPVGIGLAVLNLMTISAADKELKKLG